MTYFVKSYCLISHPLFQFVELPQNFILKVVALFSSLVTCLLCLYFTTVFLQTFVCNMYTFTLLGQLDNL